MTNPNMGAWSDIFTCNHIVPKRQALPMAHQSSLHCSLEVLLVVPFGLMMELVPTISWQSVIQRDRSRFFLPVFGIGTSYADMTQRQDDLPAMICICQAFSALHSGRMRKPH